MLHNLKTAEEAGAYVKDLNSVGGAANSRIWTQIKADITNKSINVPGADYATTLGAAILAGVGTGIYGSFDEAVKTTVQIRRVHSPTPITTAYIWAIINSTASCMKTLKILLASSINWQNSLPGV